MAQRHIKRQPQRTCIACQRTGGKRQLVRLVRRPDGEVLVDPTGKLAGRGAYLCANRGCWVRALQQRRVGRALKVMLSDEQAARLADYAAQLPELVEEAIRESGLATPSEPLE
jgi:hypothetical protein